ncbi:MAG: hypothetical protein ACR2OG_14740 [Gemmatimonadaceae bacterium]
MAGHFHHAPLVRGAYWSSYDGVARRAAAARDGTTQLLVDPRNPDDIISKPHGIGSDWLPWLFVAIGAILLWVTVVVWRSLRMKSRASRRAPHRAYSG